MYNIIIFLIFSFLVCSCSSPVESKYADSYTPISVGDLTQVVFLGDSSTYLLSIIGKTKRTDGETVYIQTIGYSFKIDTITFTHLDTVYLAITNGYYVRTRLYPVDSTTFYFKENPYIEQRIAKPFPDDGDNWIEILSRSDSDYLVAEYLGKIETTTKKYENVFGFNSFDTDDEFQSVSYYAKGIGWIGSPAYLCTYKKVSEKEFGSLWPESPFTWVFNDSTFLPNTSIKRNLTAGG